MMRLCYGCLINTNNRPLVENTKERYIKEEVKNTNDSIDLVKIENNEIEENGENDEIEENGENDENGENQNDLENLNNSLVIDEENKTAQANKRVKEDKNNNISQKDSAEYEIVDDNDSLTEIDPFDDVEKLSNENDEKMPIKIKQPNEIYYEMYKNARLQAKEAKKKAQEAYLEAKQIKDLHLLYISDSDSDSDTDINELYK